MMMMMMMTLLVVIHNADRDADGDEMWYGRVSLFEVVFGQGKLPAEIGLITSLLHMDLQGNQLTGRVDCVRIWWRQRQ